MRKTLDLDPRLLKEAKEACGASTYAETVRLGSLPALRYRDSPLLSLMSTKDHIGLYPFSPEVVSSVQAVQLASQPRHSAFLRKVAEGQLSTQSPR